MRTILNKIAARLTPKRVKLDRHGKVTQYARGRNA